MQGKNSVERLAPVLIAACCILCAGCATPISVIPYTDARYEPTDAVAVLRTAPPQGGYIEIAQIEASARDGRAVLHMRRKARELGAHALIILGETFRCTVYSEYSTIAVKKLIAIAVRYTDTP